MVMTEEQIEMVLDAFLTLLKTTCELWKPSKINPTLFPTRTPREHKMEIIK